MPTRTPARWKCVLLALAAVCATVPAWPAGEKQPKKPAADAHRLRYYSVSACRTCHDRETKYVNKENPAICDCQEMKILEAKDKHLIAHQVLNDARAKRMGELLKIDDVKTSPMCISCHGVLIPEEHKESNKKFALDQGVSCVACHGPEKIATSALVPFGWADIHGSENEETRQKWRSLSRAEKETQYGMTDLWDPAKRARLCASCHVGDLAAGKVVTHEMYAAGHPPLPGFEPATFSNEMPRHWKYLKEKDADVLKILHVDPQQAALEETHLVGVGALVSLQTSMDLLAAQADKAWPELAQFDCYACHHELKSKSWRQERGYVGKPGRPPMRPWPTALIDVGLALAPGDDGAERGKEFQARLAALQAAFDRQPFGDRDEVKKAARGVSAWVQTQLDAIPKQTAPKVTPSRLQARLVDVADKLAPDYDSARQIAWAFTALQREAASSRKGEALESSKAWQALNDYMKLKLPPGKTPIEQSLDAGLERIANYDPKLFAQKLDALLKEFPVAPPKRGLE